jgi:peroxiredoxin
VALLAFPAIIAAPLAVSLAPGEPAPACSAPLLDGTRSMSVAEYRGKVVYLDFWASWCGQCRESFPFMNDLQRQLAGKDLAIVAVSVDKAADDARRFAARYAARFSLAIDSAGSCPAAYQLPGMPTSFVIDRQGVVRAVHAGFRSGDAEAIRRELANALEHP